jgi:inosine-uridine nucleoside N-ribohydrolase
MFKRTHDTYDDTPYSVDLMRKLLAEASDTSVVIITVGFSTNLSRLLESGPDQYSSLNGKDLVDKKVKYLSMMGGNYQDSEDLKEFNIYMDEPSAKNVFDYWPTPILVSGFHVGMAVLFPASSIESDFNYVDHHPLAEAYKSYLPMPYDRPTWDLTSVLAVVEKDSSYFGYSRPGSVSVTPERFIFNEDGEGNRTFLTVTDKQAERIRSRFIELISQKPKNKQ